MTVKSENKLIPVSCFLIHIFPTGSFKSTEQDIIAQKLFKPRKDCENFYLVPGYLFGIWQGNGGYQT